MPDGRVLDAGHRGASEDLRGACWRQGQSTGGRAPVTSRRADGHPPGRRSDRYIWAARPRDGPSWMPMMTLRRAWDGSPSASEMTLTTVPEGSEPVVSLKKTGTGLPSALLAVAGVPGAR